MKKIFTLALSGLLLLILGCQDNEKTLPDCNGAYWSYRGTDGPGYWKDICVSYGDCGGNIQSPVDIAGAVEDPSLQGLGGRFSESQIHLRNTGNTIALDMDNGSEITFDGVTYQMKEVHFHTPGEHSVNGSVYPVEVHMDFKNETTGQLAVISMFLREGAVNSFLTNILPFVPQAGQEYHAAETINIATFFPTDLSYYTYTGSLTPPPCSENVTWIVLSEPLEASANQIGALTNKMPRNNRPVQQLNGRVIRHFHQ